MNAQKREQIRRTLRSLAEAHVATMNLMEQTFSLLSEELAIDAFTFWRSHPPSPVSGVSPERPSVDKELLSVSFHGRSCFLGNTLPFRLFARLAPPQCVSHLR